MGQLRIGLIGASGRGATLAEHWHKPKGRSAVVAAADISLAGLEQFRDKVNDKAFCTTNYQDLLENEKIDAIAICSPDYTHEEYAIAAFEAGKHVFTEKPMAITTEGCDRMLAAWQDSGKEFMVGFNMRYMNIFRVMKDAIDSGTIGEVKAVWVRHFVAPGGRFYYHDWHAQAKNTTSLLLQKASHDIDMIHWLTGQYTKRVVAMGALDYYGGDKANNLRCSDCIDKDSCVEYQSPDTEHGNNLMDLCAFRKEVDVEDNSIMMMELENGIKASYMQNHFAPDYHRNYTIIGTEGRIENLDDSKQIVLKLRDKSNRWQNLAEHKINIKTKKGSHGGADGVIAKDFVDMVLDGKKPIATPLAGRMSVAAGVAASQSIRNNWQAIEIPKVPKEIL